VGCRQTCSAKTLPRLSHAARRKFLKAGGAAYFELFSGPGRLFLKGTNQFIDGSPLVAHLEATRTRTNFSTARSLRAWLERRSIGLAGWCGGSGKNHRALARTYPSIGIEGRKGMEPNPRTQQSAPILASPGGKARTGDPILGRDKQTAPDQPVLRRRT
jgi:hypothetical protein